MTTWRARFGLDSFAELPVDFTVSGHRCHVFAARQHASGVSSALIDATIETSELRDAYFRALDLIEEVTDRVAYLSFTGADASLLSVTVPEVSINEEFHIALPYQAFRRSRVRLDSSQFNGLETQQSNDMRIALRMFRMGLSASSQYEAVTQLWSTVEAVSAMDALAAGDFVECECSRCGTRQRRGPATQPHIRRHYRDVKSDGMTDRDADRSADSARDIRNKIAHGGRLQDASLRREAEDSLSMLQAAAAVALVKHTNVRLSVNRCQLLGIPYAVYVMTATGPELKDINVRIHEFGTRLGVAVLPDRFAEGQTLEFEAGLPVSPDIPDIEVRLPAIKL